MKKARTLSTMTMLKLATASAALGSSVVGCSPSSQMHVANASDTQADKSSASAASRATKALAAKDFAKAVTFAEAAATASPRDAGYRVLLGQAYLNAGRFKSAETSFGDALRLDPEQERAALNLALTQVALGRNGDALKTLNDYRDKLSPSDYGLATALAGDPGEAVRVLESAARAPDADAKTRQNLGLAYALAGNWQGARVVAAQDLSPADANARVVEWAHFTSPSGPADQVASLLGVKPAPDQGQPARLALVAAPAQLAIAEPSPSVPVAMQVAATETPQPKFEVPVAAPVAVAAVIPASAPKAAPKPSFEIATTESAPVIHAQRSATKVRAPAFVKAAYTAPFKPSTGTGSFVVQLGAFENEAVASNSWNKLSTRYRLRGYDPLNARARVNNASFVRLSLGGFTTRADASKLCSRLKASGGTCFVRSVAGDAPLRFAQKKPAGLTRIASR